MGKPLDAKLQSTCTWTIIVTIEKASDSTTDWSVHFKTLKCMVQCISKHFKLEFNTRTKSMYKLLLYRVMMIGVIV